jgi:hypothetical protein
MELTKSSSPVLLCTDIREAMLRLESAQRLAPDGVRCHLENIANQRAVLLASLDPDPKSTRS